MKKTLTISLICLLSLGFIEYVNGQNLTNHQKSLIEKQVDSVFHFMIKAGENLDFDILSKGVDDKYHAGFITNGSYYTQYDSLINSLKTKSQGVTRQSITIQKEKITVLSDSIVLITAFGVAEIDVSSGNPFTVKFYWSFVYEKINNNWKVIQSHQSGIR